jgi:hypothetical protein
MALSKTSRASPMNSSTSRYTELSIFFLTVPKSIGFLTLAGEGARERERERERKKKKRKTLRLERNSKCMYNREKTHYKKTLVCGGLGAQKREWN